ncbi:MAG: glycerol kinase [Epsilonproteobacteria bacterium]|nr:MAG: glycerol kinase [Campylobacterota bacterium]RLA67578.1 MAG: glycerol kinase [Campylobacterota bacterium]
MGYILSIDQGTTGTTSLLIDAKTFRLKGKKNQEFPQIFPKPGLVEHNLNDIWASVEQTIESLLKAENVQAEDIVAIGITNQRETICAFDKTGRPLANAIVWQDRRTSDFCDSLKSQEDFIKEKTGLPIDPYFSGTKMKWLLENSDKVKSAAKSGDLLFGTIETYLLYRLTGCQSYCTEGSNASRTLLMNLKTCQWDEKLLELFHINKNTLPEIKDSFGHFGKTSGLSFLPNGIPITGILGDQQAALFGQAGYQTGDMKCTYGTGAFMLLNTGDTIKKSEYGLLSTVAYVDKGKAIYALEGSCYIAGAAVQWLRDNLQIIGKALEVEALALEVGDLDEMEHILFFPFFTGIGSPYWNANAKAAIIGLTRDSGRPHMARACLDGIALSINDLIESMRRDAKLEISELKVDGGATNNNLLLNIQASVSGLTMIRPKILETTGYGAALAAAVGAKLISMDKIAELWEKDKEFIPKDSWTPFYERKVIQWKKIIKKLFL